MGKATKRKRASDIEAPLPKSVEEGETREQIRQRKGLSVNGVKAFIDELDERGILRAKRVVRDGVGGLHTTTIVYWVEMPEGKEKTCYT